MLYGTNALSGVINVVSRNDAAPGVSAGISTNQNGVARARVRADAKFGKDGGIWASIAIARGNGLDFRFPEYASASSDGVARSVDGFESGTLRGRAYWKFLSAQWSVHSYDKHLPTAEFGTLLGDDRTKQTDSRSFIELRAEPHVSDTVSVLTRLHWNHYRFRGAYGARCARQRPGGRHLSGLLGRPRTAGAVQPVCAPARDPRRRRPAALPGRATSAR